MRRKRILVSGVAGVYHVFNRTAFSHYALDEAEREMFVRMMRAQAGFCGVDVLAYCVLSNHYHMLVRVPPPSEMSDGELLKRYRMIYRDDPRPRSAMRPSDLEAELKKGGERAERLREGLLKRMNRLPEFMKELQQRFGIWYNQSDGNTGTLWSERFRSVLVEHDSAVMRVVAAYIELNPVRAGLVERPEDWRWCSLGAAMSGSVEARAGICEVTAREDYDEAIGIYRRHIYGVGERARVPGGAAIRSEDVEVVVASGGVPTVAELLRHRIRGFTRGAVLGTSRFLRAFGAEHPEFFGPNRKRFSNRVSGGGIEGFRALRKVGEE